MQTFQKFKKTEIGEIPEGWNIINLEQIAQINYGLSTPPSFDKNGIPLIRATNIKNGKIIRNENLLYVNCESTPKSRIRFLKKNDIVVVRSGVYTGNIALIDKEFEGSVAGYDLIVSPNNKINPIFLTLYLSSSIVQNYFSQHKSRVAQSHLNAQQLANTKIVMPPPLEQQKISSIISNVDELIQKTEQIIEQTRRLKEGLMQRLLTKGIGHTKFKKISLFPKYIHLDIPEEWKLVTFEEVSKRITYGFTNPMPHTEEGPWLITAKDIKNGRIDYETSEKTSWTAFREELSNKSRPKLGTVLITKDGTLGEVAIVDREDICINQSVASIEPNDRILSEFLALSLQSPSIKKIIDVTSPATTIRHIYITEIAKWKFGLPSLLEQKKILSVISTFDTFLRNKEIQRKLIINLKKGLMQQLLTGKIRVKV